MADSALSSDMKHEGSPTEMEATTSKVTASKHSDSRHSKKGSRTKARILQASPSATAKRAMVVDRDASRRHKALERQFDKAQREAQVVRQCSDSATIIDLHEPKMSTPLPSGMANRMRATPTGAALPDHVRPFLGVSHVGPVVTPPPVQAQEESFPSTINRRAPEATFTPTAAGLRAGEGQCAGPPLDLQNMVSEAISRIFVAGIQHATHLAPTSTAVKPQVPAATLGTSGSPSAQESNHSEGSLQDKEYLGEFDLSEDKALALDLLAFPGLFRSSLFKSLLHKAKVTTNMGIVMAPVSQATDTSALHGNLFRVPKPEHDFVPCPDLFTEVIQWPWDQPGSLAGPSGHDKKLYCSAPELDALLQLPAVDASVTSLTSSSVISNDIGEGLKMEDRRAEMSFRKSH